MTYRVEIAATASADVRETTRWLSGNVSPTAADKWLAGLLETLVTLEKQPLRCPIASENDKFPQEIRELFYGKRKSFRFRIVFEIIEATVYVIYVRHTARDELEP